MNSTDLAAALPFLAARKPSRLSRLGEWLRAHRYLIFAVQWAILLFYLVLALVPAFLPLPQQGATLLNNLTLFAQFVFWGIWWPFVMLSMMLVGRVWCGWMCPEGFLSEQASRIGLGRTPPRWLRWSGWPFFVFVCITVYGQLVTVYEYPKAWLLILGGSCVVAMMVGLIWGKGKRVWCRYLCPANGIFGLLARFAPLHFRTDELAWNRFKAEPAARAEPVDCAPMLNLRLVNSNVRCHMCARCSGYRNAISLAGRAPGSEIVSLTRSDTNPWEVRLLLFGLIGVANGALQWTASPWLVKAKMAIAEWLVANNIYGPLSDDIPWWVLTHYPEVNDVFTWLDGAMVLGYIGATSLVVGGWMWLWLRVSAALLRSPGDHYRLAHGLVPQAGIGVFLGLSALSVTVLAGEGVRIPGLPFLRGALLAIGAIAALWLGRELIARSAAVRSRRIAASLVYAVAVAGGVVPWVFMFYLW
ncbi:MAG: 4Fe-4S binding protein [Betaproteobacteria bacterium]|nr:4Fe-4S binding protein [Betaproteobacteria bacterium]